jgi:hypothetical protein
MQTEVFRDLSQSLQECSGLVPGLAHEGFRPDPIQFIIHRPSAIRRNRPRVASLWPSSRELLFWAISAVRGKILRKTHFSQMD